jgi:hypothetical protein
MIIDVLNSGIYIELIFLSDLVYISLIFSFSSINLRKYSMKFGL